MEPVARMMDSVRAGFSRTSSWTGSSAPAEAVERAMLRVRRDLFVPQDMRQFAYEDRALSIGYGATISQPYIVALMTTLAELGPEDRVLEVGTGSGYQAAILAEIVGEVYTVEYVWELHIQSKKRLAQMGYTNVHAFHGDGWCGLAQHAPYDAILVTACASRVPEALVDELAPGGRLILPLDTGSPHQELVLVEKHEDGTVHRRVVLPVSFVPMVGRGR